MGIKLLHFVTDDNVQANVNPVICAPKLLFLPGTVVIIRWLQILLFIPCDRIKCLLSLKRTLYLIAKVLSLRIIV